MDGEQFSWYEFFAGGGMARIGLGEQWKCTFANEWCDKKAAAYRAYFGSCPELKVEDVAKIRVDDLPGTPDLVWASFPCQDLSLAGSGAGLDGERSGTFKLFWKLMRQMIRDGRRPKVIVLENVVGTLTSHDGEDFSAIVQALIKAGYTVGALVIDAIHFLPQSRPRLFIVGAESVTDERLICGAPLPPWHPKTLVRAYTNLPVSLKSNLVWWSLPVPQRASRPLSSLIESTPTGTSWHAQAETMKLLSLMGPLHRRKVAAASVVKQRQVGTIYKRTRPNGNSGIMAQRAEVRFDGIAGCLRTPVGGSSRQTIIVIENGNVRTRLLSPREAARLMGVPENFPMPEKYNDAYHVFGDGVAVPVVKWLETHLLRHLASIQEGRSRDAVDVGQRAAI